MEYSNHGFWKTWERWWEASQNSTTLEQWWCRVSQYHSPRWSSCGPLGPHGPAGGWGADGWQRQYHGEEGLSPPEPLALNSSHCSGDTSTAQSVTTQKVTREIVNTTSQHHLQNKRTDAMRVKSFHNNIDFNLPDLTSAAPGWSWPILVCTQSCGK